MMHVSNYLTQRRYILPRSYIWTGQLFISFCKLQICDFYMVAFLRLCMNLHEKRHEILVIWLTCLHPTMS